MARDEMRQTLLRGRSSAFNKPPLTPRKPPRQTSSGSFHAGAPIPTLASFRRQPTYRYQTFPTQPPKTPQQERAPPASDDGSGSGSDDDDDQDETPLPVKQLLLLAFLSLSEQTALNSISPYLPEMVASMPGIPPDQSGLYVGILASSFALAQLSTNFLWGYASDVVGRKPVLLMGTFSLMCCFCVFGLCRQYWQIIVVHVAMGLFNGNAACVPTVLGEVTDRSNQSKAFTYLPVIYSLGSITGPAVGGILVGKLGKHFPYLAPNVLAAAMLATSVVVVAIWFEETLDREDKRGPWRPRWLQRISSWASSTQKERPVSWSSRWPRSGESQPQSSDSPRSSISSGNGEADDEAESDYQPSSNGDFSKLGPAWRDLLNSTTVMLLITYLVFQLSNISFNSLYPIFAASPAPIGRELSPGKIGVSLSLAGVATIIFQAFLYPSVKGKLGNLGTYRFALLGIAVSMVLMPWVGYVDDSPPPFGVGSARSWLYAELGIILIIKNVCAVGGLSSVMLLITNSAPSHDSLGTLNGVAQTLSALGRSFGPFVSGGIFTLSTRIHPKGEALAWSVFGGLAVVGWIGSLFIRGHRGLESEEWDRDHEVEDGDYHDEEAAR